MGNLAEKNLAGPRDVAATVEAVFGCKWSLRILELIRQGVCRPGAIERALEGLTPRVQTYYFRRMVGLGILDRVVYPEIPPRVEYHLTEFGRNFYQYWILLQNYSVTLTAQSRIRSIG